MLSVTVSITLSSILFPLQAFMYQSIDCPLQAFMYQFIDCTAFMYQSIEPQTPNTPTGRRTSLRSDVKFSPACVRASSWPSKMHEPVYSLLLLHGKFLELRHGTSKLLEVIHDVFHFLLLLLALILRCPGIGIGQECSPLLLVRIRLCRGRRDDG